MTTMRKGYQHHPTWRAIRRAAQCYAKPRGRLGKNAKRDKHRSWRDHGCYEVAR